jgi:phosphoribosyl-AMP cyclohydrolase
MTDAIERALAEIKFDCDGLVSAVAQQHDTGEILMVAWMNRDAVRATLTEGPAPATGRSAVTGWADEPFAGALGASRGGRWPTARANPAQGPPRPPR